MGFTGEEKDVKLETSANTLVLPSLDVEGDWDNEIETTAEPTSDVSKAPKNRAFNLKQITKGYKITGSFTSEACAALNDATITNKEEALDRLETIFDSGRLVTLTVGTKSKEGYIKGVNHKERGSEDNSRYRIQIQFIKAQPFNT